MSETQIKRITAKLEPIETYLESQEKIVTDEEAWIKREAEEKRLARHVGNSWYAVASEEEEVKAEAARRAAMATDADRVRSLLARLEELRVPNGLKSKEAYDAVCACNLKIGEAADIVREFLKGVA